MGQTVPDLLGKKQTNYKDLGKKIIISWRFDDLNFKT